MPLRIGITLGDPAGIGPEIIRSALESGKLTTDIDYKVIGQVGTLGAGNPSPDSARAAFAAMEEAASLADSGEIDAIVTGPIHKARMYEIGFRFPGQTEFFADRTNTKNFAMLLTGGSITIALVTTHVPLRRVGELLSKDEIVRVGLLLAGFLHRRHGRAPRIAVAGLNPHAGESGSLGVEELTVIAPAGRELQSAIGNQQSATFQVPISPDTRFFHLPNVQSVAAIRMYH